MNVEKCLTPNCIRTEAPAMKRGLCLSCYSRAKKMVEAGTTTWLELVSIGLARGTSEAGEDLFTEAFKQAKEAHPHGGTEPS